MDANILIDDYVARIADDLTGLDKSKLPDFFILSPPRTGTSWIAENLNMHPDIYIPPEKELRYFDVGWRFSNINYYLSRFAGTHERLKGDASPTYVLLPLPIIKLLHDAKPTMKFIVVVRDLAERAWSNYNHSYALGEFGLHSTITFPGIVPEEKTINYLISDYCTSVGDYKEYLSRWLSHFPKEQFFVAGMNELSSCAGDLLRRLHGFLGVGIDAEKVELWRDKVNVGARGMPPTDRVGLLQHALYAARQHQQDIFFREELDFESKDLIHNPNEERQPKVVELVNRADGYKLFVWNGQFYACLLEVFKSAWDSLHVSGSINVPHYKSAHYGDLLSQLDAAKRGEGLNQSTHKKEEARLLSVLQELVVGYATANSVHVNLSTPRLVKEYKEFNLVVVGGAIIALRRSLGRVDLSDGDLEKVIGLYGSDNVVVGHSIAAVVSLIEAIFLNENSRNISVTEQQTVHQHLRELQQEFEAMNARMVDADRLLQGSLYAAKVAHDAERQAVSQERERLLQEAVAANERAMASIGTAETQIRRLSEQTLTDRQTTNQEIERLSHEAAEAHERVVARMSVLEAQMARFAEDATSERLANKQEINAVRQEAAEAHECPVAMMGTLEAQLAQCQKLIIEHDQKISILQANWAVRIARSIKRILWSNK